MSAAPIAPRKRESFATMLQSVDRGAFNDVLSDDVRAVVQELYHLGQQEKKGKAQIRVTMNLSVEKGGVIFISFEHQTKQPKRGAVGSMLYPDRDGRLWPSDPRQADLFKEPGTEAAVAEPTAPATPAPAAEPSPRPAIALAQ